MGRVVPVADPLSLDVSIRVHGSLLLFLLHESQMGPTPPRPTPGRGSLSETPNSTQRFLGQNQIEHSDVLTLERLGRLA